MEKPTFSSFLGLMTQKSEGLKPSFTFIFPWVFGGPKVTDSSWYFSRSTNYWARDLLNFNESLAYYQTSAGWWFQICFMFIPIWGRFPFWQYNIFQRGWNHQLEWNFSPGKCSSWNFNSGVEIFLKSTKRTTWNCPRIDGLCNLKFQECIQPRKNGIHYQPQLVSLPDFCHQQYHCHISSHWNFQPLPESKQLGFRGDRFGVDLWRPKGTSKVRKITGWTGWSWMVRWQKGCV